MTDALTRLAGLGRAPAVSPRLPEIAAAAERRPYAALVLFCLLLWLPGFFTLPPSDRDESRFAQATKQMIETGDYVRIMNGTEARNRKPIGIYWLQAPFAAAARATGVAAANPIWPYRIPSALGGLVAVLATFGLGQRIVGRRAALLAGAMLASCLLLTAETHIAKTDAALLGATTVAMGLLARAYLAPERFGPWHAAWFWVALGTGVLLKGPITPMAAGLATLTLAVWNRRAAWLARLRPVWGLPLLLAIVLPWFVTIGLATHGRFFSDAIGGDLGHKLAGGDDAHGAPPGLHLLLLPMLAFPATIPVLRCLPDAWRDRAAPATRLLIAWAAPAWLVMEAVPTKLPHYTLPLYPALFLLAARWALDPVRRPAPRWLEWLSVAAFALAATLLGLGGAALPAAFGGGWWWGLPALLAATVVAWLMLRRRSLVAALLAAPLLTWSLLQFALPHATQLWISPQVEAALAAHWPAGRPAGAGLAAVGYNEPSLMFLAGTGTRFLPAPAGAAQFLAGGADRVALVREPEVPGFLRAAAALGLHPHAFSTIQGFNYSRGSRITLELFAP